MAIRWTGLALAMYLAVTVAVPAFGASAPNGRLSPTPPVALGPAAPSHPSPGRSGAPSRRGAPPARRPGERSAGPLPHTGMDVGELALGGLALMVIGAGVELVTPPRRQRRAS